MEKKTITFRERLKQRQGADWVANEVAIRITTQRHCAAIGVYCINLKFSRWQIHRIFGQNGIAGKVIGR